MKNFALGACIFALICKGVVIPPTTPTTRANANWIAREHVSARLSRSASGGFSQSAGRKNAHLVRSSSSDNSEELNSKPVIRGDQLNGRIEQLERIMDPRYSPILLSRKITDSEDVGEQEVNDSIELILDVIYDNFTYRDQQHYLEKYYEALVILSGYCLRKNFAIHVYEEDTETEPLSSALLDAINYILPESRSRRDVDTLVMALQAVKWMDESKTDQIQDKINALFFHWTWDKRPELIVYFLVHLFQFKLVTGENSVDDRVTFLRLGLNALTLTLHDLRLLGENGKYEWLLTELESSGLKIQLVHNDDNNGGNNSWKIRIPARRSAVETLGFFPAQVEVRRENGKSETVWLSW